MLVGAASRTGAVELARELLKALVVRPAERRALDFFDFLQIYPGGFLLLFLPFVGLGRLRVGFLVRFVVLLLTVSMGGGKQGRRLRILQSCRNRRG